MQTYIINESADEQILDSICSCDYLEQNTYVLLGHKINELHYHIKISLYKQIKSSKSKNFHFAAQQCGS